MLSWYRPSLASSNPEDSIAPLTYRDIGLQKPLNLLVKRFEHHFRQFTFGCFPEFAFPNSRTWPERGERGMWSSISRSLALSRISFLVFRLLAHVCPYIVYTRSSFPS